jgi:hypothetical protein
MSEQEKITCKQERALPLAVYWTLGVEPPAPEWSERGRRDIDYKTRGARVSEREANESKLLELSARPGPECFRGPRRRRVRRFQTFGLGLRQSALRGALCLTTASQSASDSDELTGRSRHIYAVTPYP